MRFVYDTMGSDIANWLKENNPNPALEARVKRLTIIAEKRRKKFMTKDKRNLNLPIYKIGD